MRSSRITFSASSAENSGVCLGTTGFAPDGLEGNLATSKWAKLANCSLVTAYRNILDLVERGVLKRNAGGGRNSSYGLFEL